MEITVAKLIVWVLVGMPADSLAGLVVKRRKAGFGRPKSGASGRRGSDPMTLARTVVAALALAFVLALATGASERSDESGAPEEEAPIAFVLSFDLDEGLWSTTDWMEPPQIALWLENEATGEIRTLFVTRRTAKDRWEGQSVVPASLPYWVTRYTKEFDREGGPTPEDPLPDAVTGATPKRSFSHAFAVPEGPWSLYLEVNVSGDYNEHYRRVDVDGGVEDFGNGQPSLVYRARDIAGGESRLEIIGMTAPVRSREERLVEIRHITSADRLLQNLRLKRTPWLRSDDEPGR